MSSDVIISPTNKKSVLYKKPIKNIPVNKNHFKKSKEKHKNISVITVTNKPNKLNNILNNYFRQILKYKELIIIINKESISIEDWKNKTIKYKGVRIYRVNEKKSLGYCLNYGINKAKYSIISKFDDDDYYAKNYLTQVINTFNYTGAHIIGKGKYYIYFENEKLFTINKGNFENKFVKHLAGGTISLYKNVIESVKFKDLSYGTDQQFLKDCKRKNFKIYSNNKSNYIYIRHKSIDDHTWKIDNKILIKKYNIIKKSETLPCID